MVQIYPCGSFGRSARARLPKKTCKREGIRSQVERPVTDGVHARQKRATLAATREASAPRSHVARARFLTNKKARWCCRCRGSRCWTDLPDRPLARPHLLGRIHLVPAPGVMELLQKQVGVLNDAAEFEVVVQRPWLGRGCVGSKRKTFFACGSGGRAVGN